MYICFWCFIGLITSVGWHEEAISICFFNNDIDIILAKKKEMSAFPIIIFIYYLKKSVNKKYVLVKKNLFGFQNSILLLFLSKYTF